VAVALRRNGNLARGAREPPLATYMNTSLIERVFSSHKKRFGVAPEVISYAPGRVEILGNHTDYNEGFVLSAAIDSGICAAVSKSEGKHCVLAALDLNDETGLDLPVTSPAPKPSWANYIRGVINKLDAVKKIGHGFNMTFAGDLPPGAGLSSSAALEVATALALSDLVDLMHGKTEDTLSVIPSRARNLRRADNSDEFLRYAQDDNTVKLQLAKLCQQAENEFTGARCGLLDQISSLFGAEHALVFTDFRSLAVEPLPMDANTCFLLANTRVKHNLVESDYNDRRVACEKAAGFFSKTLQHPVRALRDVSMAELNKYAPELDQVVYRRAKHIIGENERVLEGRKLLQAGRLNKFGRLMFVSHESSRVDFENSCPELDFLVDTARDLKEVLGARLSGGGFGGSAVLLIHPDDAAGVGEKILSAYAGRFCSACDIKVVTPSAGAQLVKNAKRTS